MKYDALNIYLKTANDVVTLSFEELEAILSFSLPASAYKYQAWWSNGGHTQADAWMNAGYLVTGISLAERRVVFSKEVVNKESGRPITHDTEPNKVKDNLPVSDRDRFIVFDVETPNRYNNRMSAIGISVVEGGRITQDYFSYVNPDTFFDLFNIQLTGISEGTVRNAPSFPELWRQIEPLMSSGILAAHNASFDMGVLKKCLRDYGISWKPEADYCCTMQIGRRLLPGMQHKLNCLCDYYGICLDHHKADSDSRAAAEILLRYMESGADIHRFVKRYTL